MRIAQIMPAFGLAGAEIMCENLTYELQLRGHKVIVISMYDYHSAITERLENKGVDVRYLYKKSGLDFSMIYKMRKIFKEEDIDVVHTHLYTIKYAIPAAMLAGIKRRVHTIHNVAQKENSTLSRKLNNFFFKHCHVIPVALSETIKNSIVEEYKIKKEKIPVIPNGIDLSKCIPKNTYKLNGNFKILHIGRFSEQKNHKGLLEAYKLFHEKYPHSELWLIGDGEKKAEAEAFVRDHALADTVKFWGLQSDVYKFLHAADVFTLPSNYEGIPMTLIEAMGTGLPIVATTVGGVPDMLDDKSALLVPLNIDEISKAFEHYYMNESLRQRHGETALQLSDKFSAQAMAQNYYNAIMQSWRIWDDK